MFLYRGQCDILLILVLVIKNNILNKFQFQPQSVLNLFLFFGRFQPQCSY